MRFNEQVASKWIRSFTRLVLKGKQGARHFTKHVDYTTLQEGLQRKRAVGKYSRTTVQGVPWQLTGDPRRVCMEGCVYRFFYRKLQKRIYLLGRGTFCSKIPSNVFCLIT